MVALSYTFLLIGCRERPNPQDGGTVRLATTTSTVNSGLLDYILPVFEQANGIEVQVMAMGTGKALRTGRDGNCDVVLVHSPEAEQQFLDEGWGDHRRGVMYNDFVILGPANDPAAVKGASSCQKAFQRIAQDGTPFISRGDNSGTHRKEVQLWQAAGLAPAGDWYRSIGRPMGETLIAANEMQAYVLADRGTFLAFRRKIELKILYAGDEILHNPYGIIAVNPRRHPHVKHDEAVALIDFLCSSEGQKLIGSYRLDGNILFHPWPKNSHPATKRTTTNP